MNNFTYFGGKHMKKDFSFQNGILICKYINQHAIEKTLNGIIQQEEIFYKAHEMLKNRQGLFYRETR